MAPVEPFDKFRAFGNQMPVSALLNHVTTGPLKRSEEKQKGESCSQRSGVSLQDLMHALDGHPAFAHGSGTTFH